MLLYVTFPQRWRGWGFIVQPTHIMPLFHIVSPVEKTNRPLRTALKTRRNSGFICLRIGVHWWAAQRGRWNLQSQSLVHLAKDSTDLQGLWGLPPSRKTYKRLRCCCPAGLWIASTWKNFDLFQAWCSPTLPIDPKPRVSVLQMFHAKGVVAWQGNPYSISPISDESVGIFWRLLQPSPTTKSNQRCDMPTIKQSIKRIDMSKAPHAHTYSQPLKECWQTHVLHPLNGFLAISNGSSTVSWWSAILIYIKLLLSFDVFVVFFATLLNQRLRQRRKLLKNFPKHQQTFHLHWLANVGD